MIMETYKNKPTTEAATAADWRDWLEKFHKFETAVWLIIYKKDSGRASVTYNEAVDEALCYGWVDSTPNKRDANSYYQYFARRNPKSNWSRVNKNKVAELEAAGKMAAAGKAMVAEAKKTGTWDALNQVEDLIVPADMQAAFDEAPQAFAHWLAFPDSAKRGILEWIFTAKKKETRLKRIQETVKLAAANVRANQYNTKKT